MHDASTAADAALSSQPLGPMPEHPWEALAPALGATLRPHLVDAADQIIDAIRRGVPAYALPLEGAFAAAIRTGVEHGLSSFLDLIERPELDRSAWRAIYVELGRGEAREGRGLDALLAAYRLGARVAWRQASRIARAAGHDAETLATLAEAIFAYIDELSAHSAEGYADEQSAAAGETQRRRRELIALLVQTPPADPHAIEAAARAARWEPPAMLAALAWVDRDGGRAGRLPFGTLVAPLDEHWCALIGDPDAPGRRAELRTAIGDRLAALGPSVPWAQASRSAARAFATHRLAAEGVLPSEGLVAADEHLATLLAHADRSLVEDLVARRLAPLRQAPERSRERLAETLLAWLDHQGNVAAAAATLHVHPQTVRYRLGQLRERFGDDLDDPDARYELLLALRGGER